MATLLTNEISDAKNRIYTLKTLLDKSKLIYLLLIN
jgi:hypothetical protein